jgi:hypothetical protein
MKPGQPPTSGLSVRLEVGVDPEISDRDQRLWKQPGDVDTMLCQICATQNDPKHDGDIAAAT